MGVSQTFRRSLATCIEKFTECEQTLYTYSSVVSINTGATDVNGSALVARIHAMRLSAVAFFVANPIS